jgi:hypothetical protein
MRKLLLISALLLLVGCTGYVRYQLDQQYGVENPTRFDHSLTNTTSISYQRDVKP